MTELVNGKTKFTFLSIHFQIHCLIQAWLHRDGFIDPRSSFKSRAYLELCIQTEHAGVVLDEPRLFGLVQEAHQQEQLFQSEARQRLLMA